MDPIFVAVATLILVALIFDYINGPLRVQFAAYTAIAIMTATRLGIPVNTTHAITGSIVGVGDTRRLSAVRGGIAHQIVWAWVLTIPESATIAAVTYWVLKLFGVG